jgi:hypothetical protein
MIRGAGWWGETTNLSMDWLEGNFTAKPRKTPYFSGTNRWFPVIGSMVLYGNMDPINIPPMLAYIAYMDPMGILGAQIDGFRFSRFSRLNQIHWACF